MIIRIATVFLLSITNTSFIPEEDGIYLTVSNLRNNKGHVLVSLFKDGKGYPDKPEVAFRIVQLSINNKTVATQFPGIPSGNYAIAILHDENSDAKMNTNFFGLPKEGYGFSNNVMGMFGPPSLSKASVVHKAGSTTTINIKTRY